MASASVVAFEILAKDRASGVIAKAGNNVTKTTGKMRSTAMRAAGGFAALAGVGGLLGVVKSSVGLEAAFSKTMNVMQATSGASGKEMTKLRALAMKMGADTVFSAQDAAQAMLELSRGGIKPAQIAAGALKGTLTLAAAGELSMGEAANIAVKSMGQFGLKGKDMGKVAAALAGGANASSASVQDMAHALAQGGLAANSVGFSIQETTGILAAFSNKGLEGSDAGTALKTMLDRLVPATKGANTALTRLGIITEDGRNKFLKANGEYKSAAQIAELLRKGTEKLSSSERKRLITQAFGSDAQRAATVLAREGAKGVREMTKATSDQSAAQKMAAANMKGTAGALESFKGSLETAQLRLGQFLAPYVQKGLGLLTDGLNGLPAAMRKIKPVLSGLVADVRSFEPVLSAAVGWLKLYYRAVDAMPGPLKTLAIEAGLAALVLPKLTAGFASVTARASAAGAGLVTFGQRLAQNRAAMTYQTTTLGKARAALNGFGGAARNVAGVGGMLALSGAAQQSNKTMKVLLSTLGGAATGFALGGPIGALIGGAGGGLLGLVSASKRAKDSLHGYPAATKPAGASMRDLKDSLDQATGAFTRETRAAVLSKLQHAGLIQQANTLGISTRDLISATLGNEGAMKRVAAATEGVVTVTGALTGSKLAKWLYDNRNGLRRMQGEVRDTNKALSTTNKVKGDPGRWKSDLKRGVADGKRSAQRGTADVGRQLEGVKKTAGNPKRWLSDLLTGTRAGAHTASSGAGKVAANLRSGTAGARGNLSPFLKSLGTAISTALARASSGGRSIGSALGSGVSHGIGSYIGNVVSQASNMVGQAIAAARRRADAHSPSRKMIKLGREMGQGLEIGMARRGRSVSTAGADMIGSLVKGIRSRKVLLKTALGEVRTALQTINSKVADLRSQRADLASQFSSGFGTSVFGDEKATSVTSILAAQSKAAADARALRSQVQTLIGAGLSKSLVNQMVQGGSAGSAQIAALAKATPDQIAQLNALNRATETNLGKAGEAAGAAVFNDRISAARERQATAKAIAHELGKVLASHKGQTVLVQLDGKTLEYSMKKRERQQGKRHKGKK